MDYATEWRKTMVGELDIVFLGCQAAWPHLKARGGGAIINFRIGQRPRGAEGPAGPRPHCHQGRRACHDPPAPHGRRAAQNPGEYDLARPDPHRRDHERALKEHPELGAAVRDKLMLSRLGKPEDIAYAAVYLASDEAEWVTGADLSVDGGAVAL